MNKNKKADTLSTCCARLTLIFALTAGAFAGVSVGEVTADGIGLDGAFFTDDFGAARTLSGDGSTVYIDGFGQEAMNLRYTASSGTLDFGSDYGFSISDIGFATSFDASLAVIGVPDPVGGYFSHHVVGRFDTAGALVEIIPLDPSLGPFLNNPVFIGQSTAIVARHFDGSSGVESLVRIAPLQMSDGLVYMVDETFSLPTDARAMNLGSNAAGQMVGFFEVSNAASNFDVAEAGFYLVGPSTGSFVQSSIDFSSVLDAGAVLESLFVQPEGMSPDGRFVIMESDDSAEGRRALLYDFESDVVVDAGDLLPVDFTTTLRALFPDERLSIPGFNPGQLIERVDSEGNLYGRVFNGNHELVGTFVVSNTPAPQVLDLETYLAGRFIASGSSTGIALLDQVELQQILAFSEDSSAVFVAGLDANGLRDGFLLSLVELDDTVHSLDEDEDGLPDAWERAQTDGSSTAVTPDQDLAGDGLTALEEFFFGLPLDGGNASPPIGPLALDGSGLVFEFTRRTRIDLLDYDIEASATLALGSWVPVDPVVQVVGETGETTRYRATLALEPGTERVFLRFSIRAANP